MIIQHFHYSGTGPDSQVRCAGCDAGIESNEYGAAMVHADGCSQMRDAYWRRRLEFAWEQLDAAGMQIITLNNQIRELQEAATPP